MKHTYNSVPLRYFQEITMFALVLLRRIALQLHSTKNKKNDQNGQQLCFMQSILIMKPYFAVFNIFWLSTKLWLKTIINKPIEVQKSPGWKVLALLGCLTCHIDYATADHDLQTPSKSSDRFETSIGLLTPVIRMNGGVTTLERILMSKVSFLIEPLLMEPDI